MIFSKYNNHGTTYSGTTSFLAYLNWTLAAFPFSKPICRHAPLDLDNINIKCSGDDTIQTIWASGIIDPVSDADDKDVKWNNLCWINDVFAKSPEYTNPKNFICNKDFSYTYFTSVMKK